MFLCSVAAKNSCVQLSGNIATDNDLTNILVNGVSTGHTTPAGTFSFQPFQFTSPGFVIGLNTLEFDVNNVFPSAQGLRIDNLSAQTVAPEPGAITLFFTCSITGALFLGRLRRSKRSRK